LLKEHDFPFTYREYTEDPLSRQELAALFKKLGTTPRSALRPREAKDLGLDGTETDARLLTLMAEHPTLLQRPILVSGTKAVLGRPVEDLLRLV
jgi:arsenate reductase